MFYVLGKGNVKFSMLFIDLVFPELSPYLVFILKVVCFFTLFMVLEIFYKYVSTLKYWKY